MHLSCSSRSDEDKEDEEDSNRSIIIFGKRFVGRIVFVLVTQDDDNRVCIIYDIDDSALASRRV